MRLTIYTLISLMVICGPTALHAQTPSSATQRPVNNIIALDMLHITEDNIGLALSYERFVGHGSMVSLYFPVSVSLAHNHNYSNADPSLYFYGPPSPSDYNSVSVTGKGMIYFYPGIKIYPGGGKRKVNYSLGPSLVLGIGHSDRDTRTYSFDSTGSNGSYSYLRKLVSEKLETESHFKMGFMVTNCLNIRPTDHFYIGVEFGLGYSYINTLDGNSIDREPLVQFGLKLGYTN